MGRYAKQVRGQGSIYKRGKWWHVFYSIHGVKHRESAKTQIRDEALEYLRKKLSAKRGDQSIDPDKVSVRQLLNLVLSDYEIRGKDPYIEALRMKTHLLPAFGQKPAAKITSTDVENYIRRRLRKAQPATINRELALLHRAYALGHDHEPKLVLDVPHIRKLEEDNIRSGFLKPEQYRGLLDALPLELKLLFVFGYHVGMRRGALLNLKWNQVDRKEGVVWVETSKTKNRKPVPVAIPIYGDMAPYLEQQPKDGEFLFSRGSKQIQDFRASWKAACERAGVPGLLFHDLRRSAARNLRRAGVPESTCMKITGHKTRTLFERYNIHDVSDQKEAGKLAEDYLRDFLSQGAQKGTQEPEDQG